jgi:polyhydroxybutyrate depolymerase
MTARFSLFFIPAGFALLALSCAKMKPPRLPEIVSAEFQYFGTTQHRLRVDALDRDYMMYVPPEYDAGQAVPVVLVFHGAGADPHLMAEITGWNDLADAHGFVVVYPFGKGGRSDRLTWNVVQSGTYATAHQIDDLAFVMALLDDVKRMIQVDEQRVYATGMSQGGMLCYRIACDPVLSGKVAAIATVAAVMPIDPDECHATRPVPLISFHGTGDAHSRYAGGIAEKAPRNDRIARAGAAESVNYWIQKAGLPAEPAFRETQGDADKLRYGPDTNNLEVIFWTIRDGGHTWPGGAEKLPFWLVGKTSRDIRATALIWDFFQGKTLAP